MLNMGAIQYDIVKGEKSRWPRPDHGDGGLRVAGKLSWVEGVVLTRSHFDHHL